jgi:hypothetical protein
MVARHCFRGGAGLTASLSEIEEFANFLQRKAKLPAAKNESKPSPVLRAINPMAAHGAYGCGKQPDPLIISDGFDRTAGACRQGTDAVIARSRDCERRHGGSY